jgi:hypothetical protein
MAAAGSDDRRAVRRLRLALLGLLVLLPVGGFVHAGLRRAGNPRLVSVGPPQVRRACNPPGTGSNPSRPGRECFLFVTLETQFTTHATARSVMNWNHHSVRLGPPDAQLLAGLGPTGARDVAGLQGTIFRLSLYVTLTWRAP